MQIELVPLVTGLVEMVKRLGLPSRFCAILSLLLGVILVIARKQTVDGVLEGLVVGLAASGLYDVGKNPVKTVKNTLVK